MASQAELDRYRAQQKASLNSYRSNMVQSARNNTLPTDVKFNSPLGPDGQLKSQYQVKDPGAVQSPWLAQQLQQQSDQQAQQLDAGNKQAQTAAATADSGLARHGGLSSGAAERVGTQAQEQAALGAQGIRSAGDQQRLGMQTADMQNERQYQTGLQQTNLQNTLAGVDAQNQFNLGQYQTQMQAYGANKTADATAAACFVPDQRIEMADGTLKEICTVRIGDELAAGGKVLVVMESLRAPWDAVYKYHDVFVTGEHYVFEFGKWLKVKDSFHALRTTQEPHVVYNLVTEKSRIKADGCLFWDYNDEAVPVEEPKKNVG